MHCGYFIAAENYYFLHYALMQVLMDYIARLNDAATDSFVVRVPGSQIALHSSVRYGTLREHGLMRPVQLHVDWIDGDEDEVCRMQLQIYFTY